MPILIEVPLAIHVNSGLQARHESFKRRGGEVERVLDRERAPPVNKRLIAPTIPDGPQRAAGWAESRHKAIDSQFPQQWLGLVPTAVSKRTYGQAKFFSRQQLGNRHQLPIRARSSIQVRNSQQDRNRTSIFVGFHCAPTWVSINSGRCSRGMRQMTARNLPVCSRGMAAICSSTTWTGPR